MTMTMTQRAILAATAASLVSIALTAGPAAAQETSREKCYGIAKAGQNDCANLSGTHSCAGQTKVSGSSDDWKYVATGTCASLNGLSAAQARAQLKKDTKPKSAY